MTSFATRIPDISAPCVVARYLRLVCSPQKNIWSFIDSEKFSKYFGQKDELYNLNEIHTNSFQRAANIACSFQESLEFILLEVTKWAIDKTGISNVYFSGGVSHNSKAMAKIANLNKVKKFTVPPSPGDSGAALGAASFGNFVLNNKFI